MARDSAEVKVSVCGHQATVRIWAASAETDVPTILALHGFTGCGEDFQPLRQALGKDKATWICPDFMGHGNSDCPSNGDPYRLTAALHLVDRARRLAPDPENLLLLGYSMGGRMALQYLRWANVRAAVVIGASPGLEDKAARHERREQDRLLMAECVPDIRTFCDVWESQPLIEPQTRLPEPLCSELARRRRANNPDGLALSLLGCGTGSLPSLWEHLAALPPLLYLHGEADPKFAEIGRAMASRNPGVRIEAIPESGHAPHLERPAAVAELLAGEL